MEELPLYWTNPDLCETDAVVVESLPAGGGWSLVLDRTPFYPGGGGQPADRGEIDGRPLIAVRKENDRIIHEISSKYPVTAGEVVCCSVDSDFRWDSRQQHTGQHLLSAALAHEGLNTVSVHLGADYIGIEVEGSADASDTQLIDRVLAACDEWIIGNHAVYSRYLTPGELDGVELRRPLKATDESQSGPIRIVDIEGIDQIGCGGVHLDNTASIGLILFEGSEKLRGRIRLKWLIGDRAIKRARLLSKEGKRLQTSLSCSPEESTTRVEKLLEDVQSARNSLKEADREIGRMLAESWLRETGRTGIIAKNIVGGRERMEAVLEVLQTVDFSSVFLIGGASEDGLIPWILYMNDAGDNGFNSFRNTVLVPFSGKGGGRLPIWRGVIIGNPDKIIGVFKDMMKGSNS